MLHLFVPTTSFENWGEGPSDWSLSELLAELTVTASLAALTLTIIRTFVTLLFSEPIAELTSEWGSAMSALPPKPDTLIVGIHVC
jgi:hypothetical protein